MRKNTKYKKLLIIAGCIMAACSTVQVAVADIIAEPDQPVLQNKVNNKYQGLLKNNDWQKTAEIWKKLNNFTANDNYQRNQQAYQDLTDKYKKLPGYLGNLVKAKLITTQERNFLESTIGDRYSTLKFRTGMVTCYEPTETGMAQMKTESELEKRYNLLEKLAKENKINSNAYNTTRDTITRELQTLTKLNNSKFKVNINDDSIMLLYYLSR